MDGPAHHLEVDALDRDEAAELLRQSAGFEDDPGRVGHGALLSRKHACRASTGAGAACVPGAGSPASSPRGEDTMRRIFSIAAACLLAGGAWAQQDNPDNPHSTKNKD